MTTSRDCVRSPANRPDRALAAIAIGMMWVVANTDVTAPNPGRVGLLVCGAALAVLVVAARLPAGYVAGYAVLVGLAERIGKVPFNDYSDVLRATREAIEVFLAGGNPYAHTMLSTNPVGSPFPYPPGEFLFYLPAYLLVGDIRWLDLAATVGITAAIALAGLRAGFDRVVIPAMLYATWLFSSFHAGDGSNDSAAALLVVVAIVLLALHEVRPARSLFIASAICFGWALAFKQFAALFLVPILAALAAERAALRPWRAYAALSLGTAAAFVLPFLVRDPQAFIGQQVAGLTFHTALSGINIPLGLAGLGIALPPLVAPVLQLAVLAALLGWSVARRAAGIGRATLLGTLAMLAALLLAGWTSQAYWLYAAATGLLGVALLEDGPVAEDGRVAAT